MILSLDFFSFLWFYHLTFFPSYDFITWLFFRPMILSLDFFSVLLDFFSAVLDFFSALLDFFSALLDFFSAVFFCYLTFFPHPSFITWLFFRPLVLSLDFISAPSIHHLTFFPQYFFITWLFFRPLIFLTFFPLDFFSTWLFFLHPSARPPYIQRGPLYSARPPI